MNTYTFIGPRLKADGPIGGFGEETSHPVQKKIISQITKLVQNQSNDYVLVTGLASGIETWAAIAAKQAKKPYIVYLPFEKQESVWPKKAQEIFKQLIDGAVTVEYINKGDFTVEKMQEKENRLMESTVVYSFYQVTPPYIKRSVINALQDSVETKTSAATLDSDKGDYFIEI